MSAVAQKRTNAGTAGLSAKCRERTSPLHPSGRLAYRLIFLRRERIEFPQFLSETAALRCARIALLLLWTAGLPEIVRPKTIRPLAVRSAQLPTLDRHLTPDTVRGEQPLHHAAVTRCLLRRNLERHGDEPPAEARADRKCA